MTKWKNKALFLEQILLEVKHWHYSEDKALSKSGRTDSDHHWRRMQHREQMNAIDVALQRNF